MISTLQPTMKFFIYFLIAYNFCGYGVLIKSALGSDQISTTSAKACKSLMFLMDHAILRQLALFGLYDELDEVNHNFNKSYIFHIECI